MCCLVLGVIHKWRHGLRGEGVKAFATAVLRLSNKMRDDGRMGQTIVQNCVTSFVDDPLLVEVTIKSFSWNWSQDVIDVLDTVYDTYSSVVSKVSHPLLGHFENCYDLFFTIFQLNNGCCKRNTMKLTKMFLYLNYFWGNLTILVNSRMTEIRSSIKKALNNILPIFFKYRVRYVLCKICDFLPNCPLKISCLIKTFFQSMLMSPTLNIKHCWVSSIFKISKLTSATVLIRLL